MASSREYLDNRIKQAIMQAGQNRNSFYLYDGQGIVESCERLKAAFPNVDFLYSVKCNPHKQVLSTVFGCGFGSDAASFGEVELSIDRGLSKEKIFYSAPGKTPHDIEKSIDKCVLIADSLSEISKIQTVAQSKNIVAEIGIRINPDFGFTADKGAASKFGIDEAQAMEFLDNNNCPNVKITGIHVHLRSQELNADALESYYKKMLSLADKFHQKLDRLKFVNMGSGIGVPYSLDDISLDVNTLGKKIKRELNDFCRRNPDTKVLIETGRYAVCNNGWYVTRVVDKKASYGKTFVFLHNTLNGFIRPSLAQLIMKYSATDTPLGSEPLFTSKNAFEFIPIKAADKTEKVSLVGNLCTATDIIAEYIELPELSEGDLVAITNAGAYAAVLSPMQFSSQTPPAQLFLTINGEIL